MKLGTKLDGASLWAKQQTDTSWWVHATSWSVTINVYDKSYRVFPEDAPIVVEFPEGGGYTIRHKE